MKHRTRLAGPWALAAGLMVFFAGCGDGGAPVYTSEGPGPATLPATFKHPTGDKSAGQGVFRYGTFGNQRFWTDVLQLPQGIAAAGLTPLRALQLGLNVNIDALNPATQAALADALAQVKAGTDPSATAFGDPSVTLSLINQNAVQGVVVFDSMGVPKPPGNSTALNLAGGDKVGVTCALCHSITDNSVLPPTPALSTPGSVGKEIDGPIAEGIDVGAIIGAAANSRAYFPLLQVSFNALGGASIGHGNFTGLMVSGNTIPTEAEADAYLTGSGPDGRYYPKVSFDATPDGVGNPTYIQQLFRTDLGAPWGFDGGIAQLQDFNNLVYTVGLDPTSLVTTGGRAALHTLAGAVGDEIADSYLKILIAAGAIAPGQNPDTVFPLITAANGTYSPGSAQAITGYRVNEQALLDLNGYLDSLPGPAQVADLNQASYDRGRKIFTTFPPQGPGCTQCHQADPNKFVPTLIVPIKAIYPGYNATVIADRPAPLDPIQDSAGPSPFFDNRLIVFDASVRSDPDAPTRDKARGFALPMLLDLSRKRFLLNDSSVGGATFTEAATLLLNPSRGDMAAHPFYVTKDQDRADVVEFLRGLHTTEPH